MLEMLRFLQNLVNLEETPHAVITHANTLSNIKNPQFLEKVWE